MSTQTIALEQSLMDFKEWAEERGDVSCSAPAAGSATHDWDDSVMCRCFQCGIGFDELKF